MCSQVSVEPIDLLIGDSKVSSFTLQCAAFRMTVLQVVCGFMSLPFEQLLISH